MITLKPLALSLTLLGALAASPVFAEVPQKAPEIATAYAEKVAGRRRNSWSPPPIRWPPMPATRC